MDRPITEPRRIHDLLERRILCHVRRPARYIGGEKNAVRKDPADVEISFALLFPDVYEVGMSHLGCQVLYSIINGLDWACAERAYAAWPDMQEQMREHGIPLYALESFRPVRSFDVVGISLQYELLYTNALAMLALAGIPIRSADRRPDDPVVIAGGPGAASPEPMADFIDLFFPGDGEEVIVEFAELVRAAKAAGQGREQIILGAARQLPGVYAPAHYRVDYGDDGTVQAIRPTETGLPERVRASKVGDLDAARSPIEPIVPFLETVHDRITLEIMRGCTRGCRFCQAGMLRRPVRPRTVEALRELAEAAYRSTGQNEIALMSLSSSDYPDFPGLMGSITGFAEPHGINLSLSSLRVSDELSLVPEVLQRVRKSGLTIAPEAASARLRHVINKDIDEAELIEGVREAYRQGWRTVKLYFMLGLPTETLEDVAGIAALSERVSLLRREAGGGPGRVNVTIAPFVPKPHTPFQWEPMAPVEELRARQRLILGNAKLKSVRYKFTQPECSLLEAVLARGDRRVGRVIERVHREGGQFDAWREHFSFERWQRCFDEEGLSMDFYAARERPEDEFLPWEHVDFGLSREFLLEERARAFRGELTPDCRTAGCRRCGACDLVAGTGNRV